MDEGGEALQGTRSQPHTPARSPDPPGHIKDRFYAILLSVSNTSDSDNSIALIELYVTLSTGSNSPITIKIPHVNKPIKYFPKSASVITVPTKLGAHLTLTGWCYFRLSRKLNAKATITRHQLVITDTHGNISQVEPLIFTPLLTRDELRKKKNR